MPTYMELLRKDHLLESIRIPLPEDHCTIDIHFIHLKKEGVIWISQC